MTQLTTSKKSKTPVKAPVKIKANKKPSLKLVESPATKARAKSKKTGQTIIVGDVNIKESDAPTLDPSSLPKPTSDYASAFNWWLDVTTNENWAYAHNLFTPEECKKIIEIGTSGTDASPLTYGNVGDMTGSPEQLKELAKVRRSPIAWIRSDVLDNRWIFERLVHQIKTINDQFFNYDLTDIQSLQFTSYDAKEKGFYQKHVDMMYKGTGTRKLSLSVQLSDSSDYEGGDLLLHYKNNPDVAFRNQGTATFFPSWMLHEVTPVTKGKRYSLVAWVQGPRFK
jgi:PKHD-type hydroxylase